MTLGKKSIWEDIRASQVMLVEENPPPSAGDVRKAGSIPGSGRSPGGGHGNPLQSSCLENPTDRGAWWASIHGVAELNTTKATYSRAHPHPQEEVHTCHFFLKLSPTYRGG